MFSKKNENVFTSATPLYYYLKMLGIFLPSFDGKIQSGILRVKLRDKIWSFITFCLLVILLFMNLMKKTHFFASTSIFLVIAWEVCAIIGLIAVLIVLIYQFIYARQIVKTLQLVNEFDEKVSLI